MDTFTIILFISLFDIFCSFFAIDHDNIIKHPKITLALKWFIGVSFFAIIVLSYKENNKKEKQENQSRGVIDSLNGSSKELKLHIKHLEEQLALCSNETDKKIQETEDRMVGSFGNKATEIIKNANHNSDVLRDTVAALTKRIGDKSLKPAHMGFPAVPDMYKFIFRGDSLKLTYKIQNDGDLVAYHVYVNAFVIYTLRNGASLLLTRKDDAPLTPLDYKGGGSTTTQASYHFDSSKFIDGEALTLILKGYFFTDPKCSEKSKENFECGATMLHNEEPMIYRLSIPMDSLLKIANPIDANFK